MDFKNFINFYKPSHRFSAAFSCTCTFTLLATVIVALSLCWWAHVPRTHPPLSASCQGWTFVVKPTATTLSHSSGDHGWKKKRIFSRSFSGPHKKKPPHISGAFKIALRFHRSRKLVAALLGSIALCVITKSSPCVSVTDHRCFVRVVFGVFYSLWK